MDKQEKLHRYVSVSGPGEAALQKEDASHDAPVAAGFWMAWRHATGGAVDALADAIDAGAWTGVAGLFLGYALAYAWGLRARLSRIARQ